MENKINIAEILNGCPQGLKLYSPIFGEVYLEKIRPHLAIVVTTDKKQGDFKEEFLYDGRYGMNGECMLFPSKGKTTWEGFVPPCTFKDGDMLSNGICICIYNGNEDDKHYGCYVAVGHIDYPNYFINKPQNNYFTKENVRLATEEEKQKLFDAIKTNGYRWNAETKTLEKLITPNKFDITTLKTFDKVLVRDNSEQKWTVDMFSFYDKNLIYPFVCVGHYTKQCVPYEQNKHLLGTTNDCDDYYKTWE